MIGMAHSSYYRTPSLGKKGNKPSTLTYNEFKGWVSQDTVIESVTAILNHEFIDCGYRLMTSYLKRDGYVINHKKLYRIMKEEGLLKLEMDIKMVCIPNAGKNTYFLSIIDVHTRKILKDFFSFSIK